MKSKNTLPVKLGLVVKARSDAALEKVLAHQKIVAANFRAGRMSMDEVMALGLAAFCQQAGVGENFLNGDKYRDDVKPRIKQFIKDLRALAKSHQLHSIRASANSNPVDNLELRLSRVCDLLHEARLTLHSKRQEIKSLTSRRGPVVVSISDKKST